MKVSRQILWIAASLVLMMFILVRLAPITTVSAQDATPTVISRSDTIRVTSAKYHWQLVYWSDRTPACDLLIDHKGQPSDADIRSLCGTTFFTDFKKYSDCQIYSQQKEKTCSGTYLIEISMIPVTQTYVVKIPDPSIWLSMSGCQPSADSSRCVGKPVLLLSGEETLPNQTITNIEGDFGGESYSCEGDTCSIPLAATGAKGETLTFWGDSSFGDSTPRFTAYVRVIQDKTENNVFTIDVISDQWTGNNPPGCSDIWQLFPESADLPQWLDTPQNSAELQSNFSLYYLAASLINKGLVDASSCENGGLASSFTANECGLKMASPKVQYWQNQFDQEILRVAQTDDVPARLLKNMFIRESQLWPGIYHDIQEVGLGQLTENGADTALLWNSSFYKSFCPLVMDTYSCSTGFASLDANEQAILKGALLQKINASCASCKDGVDMTKAAYSIHVFAETLKANCAQVDQLIANTTGKSSREVSSYSDLWRFTLVNYNAGPGCLGSALARTWENNQAVDWPHVAANLDPACRSAVDYVVDISNKNSLNVTEFYAFSATLTSTFTATGTVTITPTFTETSTPTATPSPTGTPELTSTPTLTLTPAVFEETVDSSG